MDALAAREAYLYGFYGIPDKLLSRHPLFYTNLPDARQQEIYEIGKQARDRSIETKWQRMQRKKEAAALMEADEVAGFDEEIVRTEAEKAAALEEDVDTTDDLSIEESAKNGIINAGAMGAYNEKNDPDGSKSDAHASRYYESVRNSKKDPIVDAISRNTGIGVEEVSKMFDHLFINEYDLEKGHVRFDADYDIAESVQRLRDGKNIQEHDLLLVQHEAMEYDLMNKEELGYDEAHERVNRVYNYQAALEQWLNEQDK